MSEPKWVKDALDRSANGGFSAPHTVIQLIKMYRRAKLALEVIERDTRNTQVVGHAGVECRQCELCNELARQGLSAAERAKGAE